MKKTFLGQTLIVSLSEALEHARGKKILLFALDLAKALGTSAKLWMNLQATKVA